MVGKSNKSPSKSDRFFDRTRTINRVLAKKGISTRQQTNDASENLSDIDDAEVSGYINTKTEFLLKKIIWENINKEQVKHKKRQPKPITKQKKTTASEKPAKEINSTETREKLSSKFNYAALDRLFHSKEVSGTPEVEAEAESDQNGNRELQQSTKETLSESEGSEENMDMKDVSGDEDDFEEDNYYENEEYYGDLDLENEDEDCGY